MPDLSNDAQFLQTRNHLASSRNKPRCACGCSFCCERTVNAMAVRVQYPSNNGDSQPVKSSVFAAWCKRIQRLHCRIVLAHALTARACCDRIKQSLGRIAPKVSQGLILQPLYDCIACFNRMQGSATSHDSW